MPDDIDWTVATYAGNRQRQHEGFKALSLREKLAALEEMEQISRIFAACKSQAVEENGGQPEGMASDFGNSAPSNSSAGT